MAFVVSALFGYRDIPLSELKEKYAQNPSSFITVNGMEVHYRDEGDFENTLPIVFIHGTGSSLHTFDDWTHSLKHKHRVIIMDLPGYGLTDPFPESDYSIDNYIYFIKQFLDEIKIEKSILEDSVLCVKLLDFGHQLNPVGSMNRVDAILIDENGNLHSGADSRGDDTGIGF